MKITHRKQKGERYALVFETRQEAVQFAHYIGCRKNPQNCNLNEIRTGSFHEDLKSLVLNSEESLPTY